MSDSNLLNSAVWDDIQRTYTVGSPPFQYEAGGVMDLGGPDNVLWIKKIDWEYKYVDVGAMGSQRTAVKPIQVSVGDILTDVTRPLPEFIEPRPVVARLPFKVINTNLANNHKLEVIFNIRGVLVSPRPGKEPLPFKMMKGYVMMDSTERGRLAMKEAAADKLEETLSGLGLGSLREALPGGLEALKEYPPALQTVIIQGLVAKGELPDFVNEGFGMPALGFGGMPGMQPPALALPAADPEKEESAFMGDLLAVSPDDFSLNKSQLRELATKMIEKGWRRV